MINVTITKSDEGRIRLEILGHASCDEEGGEAVCAGVSSVFYALSGYLYNFCKEDLKVNAFKSGHADIECGHGGEEAMKMAFLGLWQLSLSYPQHVHAANNAFSWRMRECVDVAV